MQSIVAIGRARNDLAEGRPWKARERLRSFLTAYPTDQTALDLLGEIYYAMGDLPAAGAAWFLCARDDNASREAVAALRREHERSTRGLLGALRVRAPIDAWGRVPRDRRGPRRLHRHRCRGRRGLAALSPRRPARYRPRACRTRPPSTPCWRA